MHNFIMNIRRYKALILAVVPFAVAGSLLLLMNTAQGWDRFGYFLMFLYSMPVLVVLSILSVVFAFNGKDKDRNYFRTTKVVSVASLTVFGGTVLIGVYGALQSIMSSSGG